MKFQSVLVAVAFADIEPIKRLNALVRSRFQTNISIWNFQVEHQNWLSSTEFINKGLGINNSYHQS